MKRLRLGRPRPRGLRSIGTVAACVTAMLLAGCSSSSSPHAAAATTAPIRSASPTPTGPVLRQSLAPGFSALGTQPAPPPPVPLSAAPVQHLDTASLHPAPLPGGQLQAAVQSVINQPVPVATRPLLVDAMALRPGAPLTVVATNLPTASAHNALLILQGPTYRGERLLQASGGIASAIVTLPSSLPPGTWVVAVEDLSMLQTAAHEQVGGQTTADVGIFQVTP